jgi:endogenous inhibitor of DNA gyrase (YacG/DUF329 family)
MICPTCKRAVRSQPGQNGTEPFCSDRCRLVDLGTWLNGDHRIGSPVSEEDLDAGLQVDGGQQEN